MAHPVGAQVRTLVARPKMGQSAGLSVSSVDTQVKQGSVSGPSPVSSMVKVKVKVKVAQSCPTLCDPTDLVHGILQARILKWVAFSFSRGSSQPRN